MVSQSPTLLIDEEFYKQDMKEQIQIDEDDEEQAYYGHPVDIVALKVDWLLTEHGESFGKKLLEEIVNYDNLKYFKIPAVQVLTQFIYTQVFNRYILSLIPNVIDLVLQIVQFAFFDNILNQDNRNNKNPPKDDKYVKLKATHQLTFEQTSQLFIAVGQFILIILEVFRFSWAILPDLKAGNKTIKSIRRIILFFISLVPRLTVICYSIKFYLLSVQWNSPVLKDDIWWLRIVLALGILF